MRIETSTKKKLVGKRIKMSFSEDRTIELWRNFMPVRKEIRNNVGTELYSIEVYEPAFFDNLSYEKNFDKWAAVEVTDFDCFPEGMESIILESGLYAVFLYKGSASEADKIFQYIFEVWLPNSGFILDNRPHFAVMGEKYKNNDPDSEEEFWIPIRAKSR